MCTATLQYRETILYLPCPSSILYSDAADDSFLVQSPHTRTELLKKTFILQQHSTTLSQTAVALFASYSLYPAERGGPALSATVLPLPADRLARPPSAWNVYKLDRSSFSHFSDNLIDLTARRHCCFGLNWVRAMPDSPGQGSRSRPPTGERSAMVLGVWQTLVGSQRT